MAAERAEQAEFEDLLTEEVYQSVWRYCLSLSASPGEAEDLLQDALLRALRRAGQLRKPQAFRSWLCSIVYRAFLNRQQRPRREAPVADEVLLRLSADDTGQSRETELAGLALAGLDTPQRSLLVLFYFEGLSMRELAQCLGLTPLVVQGRLARARTAFRRRLEQLAPAATEAVQGETP